MAALIKVLQSEVQDLRTNPEGISLTFSDQKATTLVAQDLLYLGLNHPVEKYEDEI